YENTSERVNQEFNPIKRNQLIDLLEWRLHCMVWLRMYRRSFYDTFGLDIPDINRDEDFPISFLAHALSSRVEYVRRPLYHYNRMNQAAMTVLTSAKDFDDAVEVWSYLRDFILSQTEDKEVTSALNRRLFRIRNKILRHKEIYDIDRWTALWPDLKLRDCINLKSKIMVIIARLKLEFILRKFLRDDIVYRKSL
ncbi:MAG: hypothetical protein K2F75_02885, partial [Paramuribaculum sp.]|nr:hypothetical protein [Paramuribaculum sp.]